MSSSYLIRFENGSQGEPIHTISIGDPDEVEFEDNTLTFRVFGNNGLARVSITLTDEARDLLVKSILAGGLRKHAEWMVSSGQYHGTVDEYLSHLRST